MSFWIHAYCNESVASVTPDELASGIEDRLELLTYLFCPEEEEDPDEVLSRLRIEDQSADGTFHVFLMRYRIDSPLFIRIDREDNLDVVQGETEELDEDVLSHRSEPAADQVRRMLSAAKEDVSFCLKVHYVEALGFPLAIAAAAYLVQKAGGIIQSGSYSWMVPSGNEVEMLLEFEA